MRPEYLGPLDALGTEPYRLTHSVVSQTLKNPDEYEGVPSSTVAQSDSNAGARKPKRVRTKRGTKPRAEPGPQPSSHPHLLPGPARPSAPSREDRGLDRCTIPSQQIGSSIGSLLDQLILHSERFDTLSEGITISQIQILQSQRFDARALENAAQEIYETAVAANAPPTAPETCAPLCQKMVERMSPASFNVGAQNAQGKPIAGGQLFHKHLLRRCKEDVESCWHVKAQDDDVSGA